MTQLNLGLDATPPPPAPERRIDITLARLAEIEASLSKEELAELNGKKWWNVIVIVHRLRSMERAEEADLRRPGSTMADVYDRVVSPGENAGEAILRTFAAAFGRIAT